MGECFENWSGVNFNIDHSTVKVVAELQPPTRDLSKTLELSARRQKRQRGSHDYDRSGEVFGLAVKKRQRLESDPPIVSSERDLDPLQDGEFPPSRNDSSYIIPDSQRRLRTERKFKYISTHV